MNKQIFIINGSAGHGKDTFVEMISDDFWEKCVVGNYSSVSKVKEIAKMIGWNGHKTERDRKFLSDLKRLTTEYNDMPLNDMKKFVDNFMTYNINFPRVCFLHIREPKEIAKAVNEFKEYNAKTILIKRDSERHITSNMADENVFNYDYDIVVDNDGTLEDFREKAKCFFEDFLSGSLKSEY